MILKKGKKNIRGAINLAPFLYRPNNGVWVFFYPKQTHFLEISLYNAPIQSSERVP